MNLILAGLNSWWEVYLSTLASTFFKNPVFKVTAKLENLSTSYQGLVDRSKKLLSDRSMSFKAFLGIVHVFILLILTGFI